MKYQTGNICDIRSGCICHQVNCQNVMGAGAAKALYSKWPVVKQSYHKLCDKTEKRQLLGMLQFVPVSNELVVANSFSQFYYGNGLVNGRCYTDMDKLETNIRACCQKFLEVYIPYKIGCGLAGGNWEELAQRIFDLQNLTVIKL